MDEWGPDNVTLLFADTKIEDEDLYRFLDDVVEDLGVPLTRIADGRTPWQVFEDRRIIGNSRIDPCSLILKRELLWKWMEDFCDPVITSVYFGIDWTEEHRLTRLRDRMVKDGKPWDVRAPLCEAPLYSKQHWLDELTRRGIKVPRLYDLGFPHNNCGGFCVKAGQAHFKLLLETFPERYREHEQAEERMRQILDRDVSIMKDRRGGTTKPMTMQQFRERLVAEGKIDDEFDWGGCGCALD